MFETMEAISSANKTPQDVQYIGDLNGHGGSYDSFMDVADLEYSCGYGSQEINPDLLVLFTDGSYLYRAEYDGSEWWDLIVPPVPNGSNRPLTKENLIV